ncbi:MAG: BatD family protein [Chitinophagaceae bacterium]
MYVKFKAIEKNLLYLLATVIALTFGGITVAQVKFSTIVNERQPGINDYIQVEYTIENAKSVEKIDPPLFKDFRLIQGPMQSSGMSYINGVTSQYKSISFILQPAVKGRLVIPGAMAIADGKNIRSEAVTIEVKKEGSTKGNNNRNRGSSLFPGISPLFPDEEPQVDEEYILRGGESATEKIKKNLFVKTDVNKTSCYEGEPIMATFKLCSRLKSESRVLKRPSLNGFSVYDMIEPEANRPSVQNINGRPFNVHIIRQTQLIPLQSGTFTIDPVELDNKVKFLKQGSRSKNPGNRMQQLLEEFMNEGIRGEVEEHTFTLASKPVTITVKPLPIANKPASFNGAVGKFTMKATWKNRTVSAGEQISLQVVINGAGNLTVINPPTINLPDGIEGFDPVTKEKIDKSTYPLNGSKTFTYTFVARDTGIYKMPAVVFSYFNPAENSYKTIRSDSIDIRITPAVRKKIHLRSNNVPGNVAGEYKWTDAFFINGVLWMLAVLIVACLVIYQWKKSRKKQETITPGIMQKPAVEREMVRLPKDLLEGARWHLRQGKSQEFYNEINQSVWKVISEKINIPSTELNKFNVVTQLQNKGADIGLVHRLQALLNECEIALYTPVHTASDMEQSLQKAEVVIKDLQSSFT